MSRGWPEGPICGPPSTCVVGAPVSWQQFGGVAEVAEVRGGRGCWASTFRGHLVPLCSGEIVEGTGRGPSGWWVLAGRAEGSERRRLACQAWGPLPGNRQKPGKAEEGVGPLLFVPGPCWRNHLPTFPVWPLPKPFPPGLLGAVGLWLPGSQSCNSEAAGVTFPFPTLSHPGWVSGAGKLCHQPM